MSIDVFALYNISLLFHSLSISLSLQTVAGDDYQPLNTELTFTAQQQDQLQPGDNIVQCVDIDIIDDSSIEGEHVFTVDIASVSHSSVIQCTSTNITFYIQDNDGKGISQNCTKLQNVG